MIKNYFKTAWRSLMQHRVYSALNIFGLAIGMAVALLIGLWVNYQFSYDKWLPGYRQAYSIMGRANDHGGISTTDATPMPLAPALKKDIPGIRYTAIADWMGAHSLMAGERKIYPKGGAVGADFLRIFPYELVQGKADAVLQDKHAIVLTQSTAKALFGNADPMNRIVRVDNTYEMKVAGILKDLPDNSSFSFKFLVPFGYGFTGSPAEQQASLNWRDYSYQTFISISPNVPAEQVAAQLKEIEKKYNPADYSTQKGEFFLRPMKNWHLYTEFDGGIESGGLIDYIKTFSLIGLLVLLIACINFTNLSTARSEKRAREVGIRKAVGSLRRDLILQFLIESMVVVSVSAVLACVFVALALPAFNTLTRSQISMPMSSPLFYVMMIVYILVTGLLAGSRPAFYLTSFHAVKVLKGAIRAGRGATLSRRVLVVLQFSCSIALIISTIVIFRQVKYARERPLGYDPDRLVMTDASNDLTRHYNSFKQEMLNSGLVSSVTRSSSPATDIWSYQRVDDWQGRNADENLVLACVGVCDADYFKTMGISLKEGLGFSGDLAKDSLNVILNEAAVKRMRYKDPVGQIITWHDVPQRAKVIGIVKNAVMQSPFSPVEPTIFIYDPSWSNIISYRLSPTVGTKKALAGLSGIFGKYNPALPYLYRFVDEQFAAKFEMETLIGTLSGLFAALAIIISCLGLFGLAAYMAEQRTKEIGIRKVLGASVGQVWVLLSKDFLLLVVISCVIASVVSLHFLRQWLMKYNYRIDIGYGVFLVSAGMALLITVLTVSWQAIRAAVANPTKSLRSE